MKGKKILPLLLAAVIGTSALTGCNNIKADAVGATLDGEEISLGFMNFMARFQQAVYDGYYSAMFGPDFWSQDLFGTGSDMETSVKEEVADSIERMYLLEDHMKDYKVELTEEELSAIDKAAKQFMEDNSKEAIKQVGATEEYVREMLRLNTIQKKMEDAIGAEADTKVSDEEAAQKTFSYVEIAKNTKTNEDRESVEYTEEEKKELKNTVKEYAKKAQKDFDAAAKEAKYEVSQYTYGSDEESFAEAVIKQADKMKEKEVSGVLEDDDNYYVIRMDSTFDKEATAEKKEEIIEQRKQEHFLEVCDKYTEKAKYEINKEEWKKVNFDDLFTIKQEEAEKEDTEKTEE